MQAFADPFRRAEILLAGGRLSYLTNEQAGAPARPRIHFAHATGFNALTYRRLLAPLAAEFDIRISDARGHGLTRLPAKPEDQTSWEIYAGDLIQFLETWPGPPAALIGHSMGGTVSLLAAARRPDLARGVMMLDPPILPEGMRTARLETPMARAASRRKPVFASRAEIIGAYRGRGAFATWPDDILEDYVTGGTREGADGRLELTCPPEFEAATFSGQDHDSWEAIRKLKVPARLLYAAEGSTVRGDGVERMKALNPLITARMMTGGSHFFPMEKAEEVRSEIRAFCG